jgi:hypothetical protein
MASVTAQNPFVQNGDPRRYLPRPACEAALAELERALRTGALATLLAGPAGIGKSLLLRVLAHRLRRDFRVVLVPGLRLAAHQICDWALELLRSPRSEDPERDLALQAAEWKRRGSALVIAIDGAHELSPVTAGRLGGLALAADGGLRWLVEASLPSDALRRAFEAETEPIWLRTGMNFGETAEFVRAALAAASAAPEVRSFFDGALMVRLYRESGGVPGRVNSLAAEWLAAAVRDATLPPPAGRPEWRAYSAKKSTSSAAIRSGSSCSTQWVPPGSSTSRPSSR